MNNDDNNKSMNSIKPSKDDNDTNKGNDGNDDAKGNASVNENLNSLKRKIENAPDDNPFCKISTKEKEKQM